MDAKLYLLPWYLSIGRDTHVNVNTIPYDMIQGYFSLAMCGGRLCALVSDHLRYKSNLSPLGAEKKLDLRGGITFFAAVCYATPL